MDESAHLAKSAHI